MRKKPFKNSSHYITGGSFKSGLADAFSNILSKEIEDEKATETIKKEEERVSSNVLQELEKSYREIAKRKKDIKGTARIVYAPNYPDISFISFRATTNQATWEAAKYFFESYNPNFIGMKTEEIVRFLKAKRTPELDEFSVRGKVPIYKLMQKTNTTFPCYICGKHNFTYEDYCKDLCFIVDEDLNTIPYVQGYILCYKCHQKFC